MKISTKGRYALRLLLDLAEHGDGTFTALKDVAERQHISKKYLEQIVPVLTHGGLLLTNRGFQGGYKLTKDAPKMTVGDVLRLTEGSLAPVACLEETPVSCPNSEKCPTLYVWKGLEEAINNYLDSITIQDVLNKTRGVNPNE